MKTKLEFQIPKYRVTFLSRLILLLSFIYLHYFVFTTFKLVSWHYIRHMNGEEEK